MSPPPTKKKGKPPWVPGPPPWAGGPPPWAGSGSGERWTTLEYYHSWVADTLYISLRTDIPCHLWLYWTDKPPLMHPREKTRRGVKFLSVPDYCLVEYQTIEQNEPGDTEWHTFEFNTWPDCEYRWWFYAGQEGGVDSPSTSPIFTAHKPDFTEEESMRHIDLTHKEVAGVIDHADRSVTADKLELNLDGVAIGLDADKLDGKHASEIPIDIGARVYRTAPYAIAHNTWTQIAFDNEAWDTDNIHSNTVLNHRLTCKTAGKYHISLQLEWAASAVGERTFYLIHNNTTIILIEGKDAAAAGYTQLTASTIWNMAVNDFVHAMAYQDSGGILNIVGLGHRSPCFMMQKIG